MITQQRLAQAYHALEHYFQADTDPEEMAAYTLDMARSGMVEALDYGPVMFFITPQSRHVVKVEMMADPDTGLFTMSKALKHLAEDLAKHTAYHKMEGRTPIRAVAKLVEYAGGAQEGVRKESIRTDDGAWLDEYEFGFILRR